jgi:hypothetical protein
MSFFYPPPQPLPQFGGEANKVRCFWAAHRPKTPVNHVGAWGCWDLDNTNYRLIIQNYQVTRTTLEVWMSKDDEKITVENVNVPERTTRVNRTMYEAMKKAMWKVLPTGVPGLTQAEIREAVVPHLPEDLYPGGAKVGWWAKTVQLDQEAKGTVVREATKPLRWHRLE